MGLLVRLTLAAVVLVSACGDPAGGADGGSGATTPLTGTYTGSLTANSTIEYTFSTNGSYSKTNYVNGMDFPAGHGSYSITDGASIAFHDVTDTSNPDRIYAFTQISDSQVVIGGTTYTKY